VHAETLLPYQNNLIKRLYSRLTIAPFAYRDSTVFSWVCTRDHILADMIGFIEAFIGNKITFIFVQLADTESELSDLLVGALTLMALFVIENTQYSLRVCVCGGCTYVRVCLLCACIYFHDDYVF